VADLYFGVHNSCPNVFEARVYVLQTRLDALKACLDAFQPCFNVADSPIQGAHVKLQAAEAAVNNLKTLVVFKELGIYEIESFVNRRKSLV